VDFLARKQPPRTCHLQTTRPRSHRAETRGCLARTASRRPSLRRTRVLECVLARSHGSTQFLANHHHERSQPPSGRFQQNAEQPVNLRRDYARWRLIPPPERFRRGMRTRRKVPPHSEHPPKWSTNRSAPLCSRLLRPPPQRCDCRSNSLVRQVVVATAVPIAPAAKRAARDRRPASVCVRAISALAVRPQHGQVASPCLTCREHPGHGQNCIPIVVLSVAQAMIEQSAALMHGG
jgi:hypothetical protein